MIRDYQAEVIRIFQNPKYMVSGLEIVTSTPPSITVRYEHVVHAMKTFTGPDMWRDAYRFIMLIYNELIKQYE